VNLYYAQLDEVDRQNIWQHGQLYSVCEDCGDYGEHYSIEKTITGEVILD
jgi:hypothetical protein